MKGEMCVHDNCSFEKFLIIYVVWCVRLGAIYWEFSFPCELIIILVLYKNWLVSQKNIVDNDLMN